jgi:hypothetical protein
MKIRSVRCGAMRITAAALLTAALSAPALAQPSLLSTLQAFRAQYPTPMSAGQKAELLVRTAQTSPGWVLLLKMPPSTSCPTSWGALVACDILIYAATGQGYDVLIDQDNAARPSWQPSDVFTPDRFVAVPGAVPAPMPPPVPVPVPMPPPVPPLEFSAAIQRLYDQAEKNHKEALEAINSPGWFRNVFSNRYVQLGLAVLTTYLAQQQMTKPAAPAGAP